MKINVCVLLNVSIVQPLVIILKQDKEKKLVKNNIEIMNDFKYPFRINLMFHKDHFEECIEMSNWFDKMV